MFVCDLRKKGNIPTHLDAHALPIDEAARLEVEVPPPPAAALARQVRALGRDGVGELVVGVLVGGNGGSEAASWFWGFWWFRGTV